MIKIITTTIITTIIINGGLHVASWISSWGVLKIKRYIGYSIGI